MMNDTMAVAIKEALSPRAELSPCRGQVSSWIPFACKGKGMNP